MIRFYFKEFFKNPCTLWCLWFARIVFNIYSLLKLKVRISRGVSFKKVKFEGHNFVGDHTYLMNSEVGLFSYIADSCNIGDTKIGRFCSIGTGTLICPGRHPSNFISTHPFFYSSKHVANNFNTYQGSFQERLNVVIGNDVWIGAHCVVLDGVTIGDGAIIGAGSVVTKDIDAYSIVGGVPAREIRKRFDSEVIKALLAEQWWNQLPEILRGRPEFRQAWVGK